MKEGRVVMATSSFDRDFIIEDEVSIGKFLSIIQDEHNRKPISARPQTIIDKKRSEGLLKRLLSH